MQENYKKEARHTSIQLVDISSEIAFLSLSCFIIRRYFLNFSMYLLIWYCNADQDILKTQELCVTILPSIKDQILVENRGSKIRMLLQF